MALFQGVLPKRRTPIRTALQSLSGRIRNKIETVQVYNPSAVAYPIGTIVSYTELFNGSTDYPGQVRPSTDSLVPAAAEQCKGQFCGVLEAALAAGTALARTVSVARHNGGPVYCRLDAGQVPHVGDAVWANPLVANAGMGVTGVPPSAQPIYVGMIDSLGNYNPLAPAGTTGVYIIVKHEAPVAAPG